MAEYIDKDALLDDIVAAVENGGLGAVVAGTMKRYIMRVPADNVAPVVHGRWLPEHHKDKVSQTEYHSYIWYHCSECGRRLIGCRNPREAPYCHCGAKMDLRGEDNDGTEKA